MKKIIALTLAVVLALACAACTAEKKIEETKTEEQPAEQTAEQEPTTQIANPFVDCDTLADAETKAGFTLTAPDSIGDRAQGLIQAIENELIQIFYSAGEDDEILVRKGKGSDDISGVYTEYGTENTFDDNGTTVTLKGEGDTVNLAVWTKGDYTYSVYTEAGLSESDMVSLVQSVD